MSRFRIPFSASLRIQAQQEGRKSPVLFRRCVRHGWLYSVSFEDYGLSLAVEDVAKQEGMERHVVRRNFDDAESFKEPRAVVPELFDEGIERRLVAERSPRVTGNMGKNGVDFVLVQAVERHAVFEDPAHLAVFPLHMRLLARAIGVAVEQVHSPRKEPPWIAPRVRAEVLNHFGVGKFRSVVREDDEEEFSEQVGARRLPEHVEKPGAGVGCLSVSQKRKHQAAGKLHREEDLAADDSDDRVQFRPLRDVVDAAELQKRLVVAPGAAFGLGPGAFLLPLGTASAGFRQIGAPGVEKPPVDVVVDGALGHAGKDARVVRDDIADGLAFEKARGEDRVHPGKLFVCRLDAHARIVQEAFPVGLRAVGDIEPLGQRAGTKAPASVADVGRDGEMPANGLGEVRASFEALRRVLAQRAVSGGAEDAPGAGLEMGAQAVGAPVAALADDGAADDFPQDCRLRSSAVLGDLAGRGLDGKQELDPLSV